MGKEINKSKFTSKDFKAFRKALKSETSLLQKQFKNHKFTDEGLVIGLEIEGWLVDKNYQPASVSDEFIQGINDDLVVHELMKFNFELNVTPVSLENDCLIKLEEQLQHLWSKCILQAEKMNCHAILIGMLPTAKVKDFKKKRMSSLLRYHALNEQILKKRQNKQIDLSISGVEQHIDRFYDILLEASTTSTQIHLQLPPKKALDYFNAAIYISAACVGISSNSPFFFERHLWEETRIPIFEQIVYMENEEDPKARKRTGFNTYLKESIMEIFQSNLESFSPLLPVKISDDDTQYEHLRLHNGTIWRWNRPIIGKSREKWHLRLEHRPISSGPTIVDIMANIAFFIGTTHALSKNPKKFKANVNAEQSKANFYSAARYGLLAKIRQKKGITELRSNFESEYIPLMKEGLENLNIDKKSQQKYINIISERVRTGQTGANWQSKYINHHGRDFNQMIKTYIKNQNKGHPVHLWDLDE